MLTLRDAIRERSAATSWREHGRCRGVDPEIFFPAVPTGGDAAELERFAAAEETAKAICVTCPVREACLEHALSVREKHGVWGGLTERERRRILRRRRRSA